MDRTIQNNGLLRKEARLLTPFIREPWRQFTLTEIKKLTKNRSHHYVYDALEKFTKKGVITKEKKGNTNIYAVDYKTKEFSYFVLAENMIREERTYLPVKVIYQITDKIKSPFYTLLITGSYVEKKQKPKSDLDIAIIIPNNDSKKPFAIALKEGELTIPEVHGFVFTAEEFNQMLVNDEFNYGKECARKHIIIYGAEQYYKILFEAMKNGFKG